MWIDDTYETQSRISFVASRFENGEFITCEANNPVLEFYNEEPQRASITLQVSCKYYYKTGKKNLFKCIFKYHVIKIVVLDKI